MKISQTADGFAKLNLSSMDYYFDVLNKCILLRFYRTPKKNTITYVFLMIPVLIKHFQLNE